MTMSSLHTLCELIIISKCSEIKIKKLRINIPKEEQSWKLNIGGRSNYMHSWGESKSEGWHYNIDYPWNMFLILTSWLMDIGWLALIKVSACLYLKIITMLRSDFYDLFPKFSQNKTFVCSIVWYWKTFGTYKKNSIGIFHFCCSFFSVSTTVREAFFWATLLESL